MIKDRRVKAAVSKIARNAHKELSEEAIKYSFNNDGLIERLYNVNHQIVFGRRGTGKTHLFKFFSAYINNNPENEYALYIDLLSISGSSHSMNESRHSNYTKYVHIYKDLLSEIHKTLCEIAFSGRYLKPSNCEEEIELRKELDCLADAILQIDTIISNVRVEERSNKSHSSSTSRDKAAEIGIHFTGVTFEGGLAKGHSISSRNESDYYRVYEIDNHENLVYRTVNYSLDRILSILDVKLFVMIDEWSSIDVNLQPYCAELMRRTLFTNNRIIVKLAAIEFRTKLCVITSQNRIGLEMGSDIYIVLDFDNIFLFDENPDKVIEHMSKLLYNHLKVALKDDFIGIFKLNESEATHQHEKLMRSLFDDDIARLYFIKCAEGNPRDLINILDKCFEHLKDSESTITLENVLTSAKYWYSSAKESNLSKESDLSTDLMPRFKYLVNRVIELESTRSFILKERLFDTTLQMLHEKRIIHILKKRHTYFSDLGEPYLVFIIDFAYCAYLMGQQRINLDIFDKDEYEKLMRFAEPLEYHSYTMYDLKRNIRNVVIDSWPDIHVS